MDKQQHSQITPSELIVLHSELFANSSWVIESWRYKIKKLLGNDTQMQDHILAPTALIGAFLACEQAGTISFELVSENKYFGLREERYLFVRKLSEEAKWTPPSLESKILWITDKEVPIEVFSVIDQWMRSYETLYGYESSTSTDGATRAIEIVKSGLVKQGVLNKRETIKIYWPFTETSYKVQNSSKDYYQDLVALRQLLENCYATRPEIWSVLMKQIKSGIAKNTEWPDLTTDYQI